MIEGAFINEKLFDGLERVDHDQLKREVNILTSDLQRMSSSEREIFERGLKIMSQIACYQAALSAKVSSAIVSDQKEANNRYVHVRGSVLFQKGKRVWVGHYIGEEKKHVDDRGRVLAGILRFNRIHIIKKLVERLKSLALKESDEQ